MKYGKMRKGAAIMLSAAMFVPMAAQAEAAVPEYKELTLNNVVINYAGTELDFSGLDIKLLGGLDAANKQAIGGVLVNTPASENSTGVAMEFGADAMNIMGFGQLMEIPYAGAADVMTKLTGADMTSMGDMQATMDQMWTILASAPASTGDMSTLTNIENELNTYIQTTYGDQLTAIVGEPTVEDATFNANDVDYTGTKTTIALTPDQASELMGVMGSIYTDDTIMGSMNTVMSALDSQLAASGSSVSMSDFYSSMYSSLDQVKFPEGMNISVYTADGDAGESVVYVDMDKMTIDMADYMATVEQAMTESGMEVETDDEDMEAMSTMAFDAQLTLIGTKDDAGELSDASYIDGTLNYYAADAEEPFMDMYIMASDDGVDGALSAGMYVIPSALEADSTEEPINADVSVSWSNADDAKVSNGSFTFGQGDDIGSVDYSLERAISETGETGSFVLSATQDTTTTNVISVDYTSTNADSENISGAAVDFDVDLMGMITAKGTATYSTQPMSEDLLMSTSGAAIDMTTATTDDINAMIGEMSAELQNAVMGAMQVPGVALIMNTMTGASDEVTTEEVTPDEVTTDTAIAG